MSKILTPESSAIESLSYNEELEVLFVYFRPGAKAVKGGIYAYFNVPLTEYAKLTSAQSPGKYLNEVIKHKGHPYHLVKSPVG